MSFLTDLLEFPVHKEHVLGTHRVITPEQTVAAILPVQRRFGISRIANVTGLDWLGIPVVMVCRPNSRSVSVSQGKGVTLTAAKASGLMEAIELHHAETILNPVVFGSAEELSADYVIMEVENIPLIDISRYHRQLRIPWVEGFDLGRREAVMVPFGAISVDTSSERLPGADCFSVNSNGLASGNHHLEAISHGVCELIERDASALWYASDEGFRKQAFVDLDTVSDPLCREILALFEGAKIDPLVWDMTTDIGIPSLICLAVERSNDPSRIVYASIGMGCHPQREIALVRALCEAAQSRLTLIAGSRDDMFQEEYELNPWREGQLRGLRSLRPSDNAGKKFSSIISFEFSDFRDEVLWEIEQLKRCGLQQVIVVALTKVAFGFPVVRIVIPGLEGPTQVADYVPGERVRKMQGAIK